MNCFKHYQSARFRWTVESVSLALVLLTKHCVNGRMKANTVIPHLENSIRHSRFLSRIKAAHWTIIFRGQGIQDKCTRKVGTMKEKRISLRTPMVKCCLSSLVCTRLEHIFTIDWHNCKNKENLSHDRSLSTVVLSAVALSRTMVWTSDHLRMSIDRSLWLFSKSCRHPSASFGRWNSRWW